MNRASRLRAMGAAGIIGGLLWFVPATLEATGLLPVARPGTGADTLRGSLATVALALACCGFLGIGAGGALQGRLARATYGVAVLGYGIMLVGAVLTILGVGPLTDPETAVSLIYLLGRLIAVVCTLLVGLAVVLARRWSGWTRWAPLPLGVWPILGELLPALLTGGRPPALLNAGWGLAVALVGLAVLAQTGSAPVGSALAGQVRGVAD